MPSDAHLLQVPSRPCLPIASTPMCDLSALWPSGWSTRVSSRSTHSVGLDDGPRSIPSCHRRRLPPRARPWTIFRCSNGGARVRNRSTCEIRPSSRSWSQRLPATRVSGCCGSGMSTSNERSYASDEPRAARPWNSPCSPGLHRLFPPTSNEGEPRPLTMNAVSLMLTRRYHAGGGSLRCFGSHRIRHATATLLVNNGMPLEEVSRYLGHSSTVPTRRYAQQTTEALGVRAASALARAGLVAG
jgi:hypothetical protein